VFQDVHINMLAIEKVLCKLRAELGGWRRARGWHGGAAGGQGVGRARGVRGAVLATLRIRGTTFWRLRAGLVATVGDDVTEGLLHFLSPLLLISRWVILATDSI